MPEALHIPGTPRGGFRRGRCLVAVTLVLYIAGASGCRAGESGASAQESPVPSMAAPPVRDMAPPKAMGPVTKRAIPGPSRPMTSPGRGAIAPSPDRSLAMPKNDRPVRIVAVGDLMAQDRLLKAMGGSSERWTRAFDDFLPAFKAADLVFGNLETPVTEVPWSARLRRANLLAPAPAFRSDRAMLRGVHRAGFTLLGVANNHILDQGPEGLAQTLENLEAEGLGSVGVTPRDRDPLVVVNIRGVRIGVLAFAAFTNVRQKTFRLKRYTIGFMNEHDPPGVQRALEMVTRNRPKVDLLVLSLHWGWEFDNRPSTYQRAVASKLIRGGADVILGHHPHVLQPASRVLLPDGRRGFVIFSLGNSLNAMGIETLAHYRKEAAGRSDSVVLTLTVAPERGRRPRVEVSWAPAFSMVRGAARDRHYALVDLRRELSRRRTSRTCMEGRVDTCRAVEHRLGVLRAMYQNLPETPR